MPLFPNASAKIRGKLSRNTNQPTPYKSKGVTLPELRGHFDRNTQKLNFFADYTKRYQEIVLNFPENIHDPEFDFDQLTKEERDKTHRYMKAYFSLCSEEFYLWKAEYIKQKIWENWKEGIEFTFAKKAFQDAWKKIVQMQFIILIL